MGHACLCVYMCMEGRGAPSHIYVQVSGAWMQMCIHVYRDQWLPSGVFSENSALYSLRQGLLAQPDHTNSATLVRWLALGNIQSWPSESYNYRRFTMSSKHLCGFFRADLWYSDLQDMYFNHRDIFLACKACFQS